MGLGIWALEYSPQSLGFKNDSKIKKERVARKIC
jgi:hypothetical protein